MLFPDISDGVGTAIGDGVGAAVGDGVRAAVSDEVVVIVGDGVGAAVGDGGSLVPSPLLEPLIDAKLRVPSPVGCRRR